MTPTARSATATTNATASLRALGDPPTHRAGRPHFTKLCPCQRRIEAGRAELHRTLESVLVIDMRMNWNGIGNSCAGSVLRLGTATDALLFMAERSAAPGGCKAGSKPLNQHLYLTAD